MTDTTPDPTARVTPDDIPTSVTKLVYTCPLDTSRAVSQNEAAALLAHYWPAIEQHFRRLLADEIAATSQRLLDHIPEGDRSSRDWDQHEEWLEAASTIRPADASTATAPTHQEH